MPAHPDAPTLAELAGQLARPEEDLTWQESASCAEIDPDLWFPERGASLGDINRAKQVCAGCEVRTECLTYALTHDEAHGIWGGLSEFERRDLRRRTRPTGLGAVAA